VFNEFDGLREWQKRAVEEYLATEGPFLGCACPGSGKTRFASRVMAIHKSESRKPFSIVVCPTDAIKDQWAASAHVSDGLNLTTRISAGDAIPAAYHGAVVTYAQLSGLAGTIRQWARNGWSVLLVPDEVHHCSEDAAWGESIAAVGDVASRVLALSGTPFRSDGNPIPFVEYDELGFAKPQYAYTYSQAIADGVCRRVMFRLRDARVVRKWSTESAAEECLWSQCGEDYGSWLQSGLVPDGDAVRDIITDCWGELNQMIEAGDRTAACGIHCKSSGHNDADDKYVNKVAKVVRQITGHRPLVIHHGVPGVSEAIGRFRDSRDPADRFIVSIRQFGEGVDIPRCRVGGYLSNISSEMYLRQVVGRYVRYEQGKGDAQYAVMVMPDIPVFRLFASQVEQEAKVGVQQAEERRRREREDEKRDDDRPVVQTLSVVGEGGSIVMSGDLFDMGEESVRRAEAIAAEFPSYPVGDIARIISRSAVAETSCAVAEPPMNVRCKELRRQCNTLAMSICASARGRVAFQDVKEVYAVVNKRQGVPFGVVNAPKWVENNRGVDGLEQRLSILREMKERYA
jgi:superfamily II DNA or RNA helicase